MTTREWQAANTIAVSPLASHTSDSDGTAEEEEEEEAEEEEEEEEEEGEDWWSAALMTPTGTS
jgi:ribosomal protein L12E/L44/L45/RPP1/RPP2